MQNKIYRCFCLSLVSVFCWVAADKTEAQESVNVMTYNIRYANTRDGDDVWSNRSKTVGETIAKADIAGLQEVLSHQLKTVEKATGGWTWYGVGRDDGKEGGESAPIGFRNDRFELIDKGTKWLSETPDVPGSRGWDAALPRTFTWMLLQEKPSKKKLMVINTHFDHRGAIARENSGSSIAKFVDGLGKNLPVIVMGDFNANPESKPLTQVMSGQTVPLKISRELSKTAPSGPTGTWNGFKAIAEGNRIDHIFVNEQVSIVKHETWAPKTTKGRFASDHLPVVATIAWE